MNKDLIILVADQNMRDCIEGLLPRFPHVLNTAEIHYDIFVHTNRDPGCRTQSSEFLKSFQKKYHFALVLFDKEGSGKEGLDRIALESEVENKLSVSGWGDRAKVIVIEPELENWIWIKSPKLAEIINWPNIELLYQWLADQNYLAPEKVKPNLPKKAFEEVLYLKRKRRSSSIYKQIASQVSFRGCTDPSFSKLIQCFHGWFPKSE